VKSYIIGVVILAASIWLLLAYSSSAPGENYLGPLVPLTSADSEAADRLQASVEALSQDIGPRGTHTAGSQEQVDHFLMHELQRLHIDGSEITFDCGGTPGKALEASFPGRTLGRETIVLAAHVDSAPGSPGADDNASGVAVLLEMLRTLQNAACDRTLRFVFWTGGAAPTAGTDKSAAGAYAQRLHGRREKVAAVLCFDSLGVYNDAPGTESVPFPFGFFFSDKGNFVGFVGDWGSRGVMDHTVEQFRLACKFPSQAFSLPSGLSFISDSDDGVMRDAGFPALRVTDTAQWRSPAVGTSGDIPNSLDYARMARVARGLADMVAGLAKRTTPLM
jgi:hypothetical protein